LSISKDSESDRGGITHNALRLLSTKGLEGADTIVDWELEKDPGSWEAWAAKADILYLKKRYREALDCCDKSLAINSENALTWYTQGNALYMLKRYDEAIVCYNQAIEMDPFLAKAWYNKKLAVDIQLKSSIPKISAAEKSTKYHSKKNDRSSGEGDGSLHLGVKRIR
jgi:tetratricopeptide (TPR) repeat protein